MHDEDEFTPEENELTPEDLELLLAFERMDSWPASPTGEQNTEPSEHSDTPSQQPHAVYDLDIDNEMLQLFATEAEEDINKLQHTLEQLAAEATYAPGRFMALQRASHKLRGTAGAIGYLMMSTLAGHIEIIAEQVGHGMVAPEVGKKAIDQAFPILKFTLEYTLTTKKEPDDIYIQDLEEIYQQLDIDLNRPLQNKLTEKKAPQSVPTEEAPARQELPPSYQMGLKKNRTASLIVAQMIQDIHNRNTAYLDTTTQRFQNVHERSERLVESNATLINAQLRVEKALQDLNNAQVRAEQLESELSKHLANQQQTRRVERKSSSSLIARILHEASQDPDYRPHSSKRHTRLTQTQQNADIWDELDIEHYTEQDKLVNALREAMVQVGTCTYQLSFAYNQLQTILKHYINETQLIHSETLQVRLVKLNILIPGLRAIIEQSQVGNILFDVTGENIEADIRSLETLAPALNDVLQTCIQDISHDQDSHQQPFHIWLHASTAANIIKIDLGFSMTVNGGTVKIIRDALRKINGDIALQRNTSGGMTISLHFPHSYSVDHCLLVSAGGQQLMIPLAQIQYIGKRDEKTYDATCYLHELLDFPATAKSAQGIPIILRIENSKKIVCIIVDEVLEEVELVTHALKTYLQRPGIHAYATDGDGNVLLLLDLLELVNHYYQHSNRQHGKKNSKAATIQPAQQPVVLVADDSVLQRQAILQTLRYGGYEILEARDGLEALELITQKTPDVFLLDVEMPNLNGYDLLSIMGLYPEFSHIKIIMLTSRSSPKHIQRAKELGAHVYLTKPAPHDVLLNTIKQLLEPQNSAPSPGT